MDAAAFFHRLPYTAAAAYPLALRQSQMAIRPFPSKAFLGKPYSSVTKASPGATYYFQRSCLERVLFLSAKGYSTEFGASGRLIPSRKCYTSITAAKESDGSKQEDGMYKNTLDLPKTKFDIRANAVVREPEIQKRWDENRVYERVSQRNSGEKFILHDGPPYANGDLHMGHAMNKILKDIINRYKLLHNFKVHYVPGWDCHGLPIELKVLHSMDDDARKQLSPLKLRQKAAKFAKDTVKKQMKSFKRYGVWADWDNPYLTLNPEYEAAQIEVFGKMALQGYIYRGWKPVHWSPSSRTALAEAELEYPEGHSSRSIYTIFKLASIPSTLDISLQDFFPDLHVAVWTTTPWTIPANAAVAVNGELLYAVVEVDHVLHDSSTSSGGKKLGSVLKPGERKLFIIVASELVPLLEAKWGVKLLIRKTFAGDSLENCRYEHPVDGRECPIVLGGDYITTESGTGLVHTAPGHGLEDYVTGLKYGLPILSPVDENGKFTQEAGKFSGLDVLGDGNIAVVKHLDETSSLLMEEVYRHKYPYDWRTKKPTIFRATEQWFASVEDFRQAAMDAISKVTWIPAQAENRISAMTSSRSDWCISRQRTWGVPIPVFYHKLTKEPLMDEETINHVKTIILNKGSDAWWYMGVEELLPDKYRAKASDYQKGTDTMDVWFDSGSSWAAVLEKRDGLQWPADLYIEGTDQHRGWFQSSLLTSIATKGNAPYSRVITHGFVLDEKGLKMSKSLGNVVDPQTVIEGGKNLKEQPGYGADVLRLWVSSVDYTVDVPIGPQILRQTSETYRKLRVTLRYLLSNLHDWKNEDEVPYEDLPTVDQHALYQLENVINSIKESYENYQFYKIIQIIQRFAIVDLSNFYFDVAKDRLYTGGTGSFTRRSCQTVLAAHLLSIVRVLAPVLPHLAEDVWQHLPFELNSKEGLEAKFVFEGGWPEANERWQAFPVDDVEFWRKLLELRTEVNKVLEVARTGKLIGPNLEAKVYLHTNDTYMHSKLQAMCSSKHDADRLHRIFVTSQVINVPSLDKDLTASVPYSGECMIDGNIKIWIGVSRADGLKCDRCWNYSPLVGSLAEHPKLCGRCYDVIGFYQPATLAAVS